jgi:hypothetical protein
MKHHTPTNSILFITEADLTKAHAYANWAVSQIPAAHSRKRASAAYDAYMEYFNNLRGTGQLQMEIAPTQWERQNHIIDYTEALFGDKIVLENAVIVFVKARNFGNKRYPDVRSAISWETQCYIYRITADNICYTDCFGKKTRVPIDNVIAIIRP